MKRILFAVIIVVGSLLAFTPLPSQAQGTTAGDALDAPGLPWQLPTPGGWYPWLIDTNTFIYGGASLVGEADDFYDSPGFSTTLVGPGTLFFWYRLSGSWNPGFGQNTGQLAVITGFWDYLFSTDQDTDWTQASVFLPSGTNAVLWALEVLAEPNAGVTGWVDHVEFQPGGTPPFVEIQPGQMTFVTGGSGTLQAAAGGTPPLAYQWRCNGTNLPDATAAWLSVSSSAPGQTNLYSCAVSNAYGTTVSSASCIHTLGGPCDPWIMFTYVPYTGSADYVRGLVGNVSGFSNYVVAAYIYAWTGWWNKPYWNAPITTINDDGTFAFCYVTGGVDSSSTSMMVFLLPQESSPPQMSGQCCLPFELYEAALAVASVSRVPEVPSLMARFRADGAFMMGLEGALPGHSFAIQRSAALSGQPWVVLPDSTNTYGCGVEFEYHPEVGERSAFFRGIEVP